MENTSPHSILERSKHVRRNAVTGKEIREPMPSPHEVAILRRAARGYVQVTMREGTNPLYSYDDGVVINSGKRDGSELGAGAFNRMVKQGWLIPIKGESLLGDEGPAQRYTAQRLIHR
jgi:hypothetical protein